MMDKLDNLTAFRNVSIIGGDLETWLYPNE